MSTCKNINTMQADLRQSPRNIQIPKKTYFASIWPTDGCVKPNGDPFRCGYCFYDQSELRTDIAPPNMMTLDTADAVVDFINSGQVNGVSFFGGEPTCNWPVIERILLTTDEMKMRKMGGKSTFGSIFSVTSNGVHMTKERLRILASRYVHIILSFDGTKETQDMWRDGSYDAVMKNLDGLVKHPSITVTKTLANPTTYYEDVKHIKELGFKYLYTNFLDPYGKITYDGYDVEDFKTQYRRVIKELHGHDGFTVGELAAWKGLQEQEMAGKKIFGCGFTGSGLGINPEGHFYPCHQGPSLPEGFRIGNVWDGVDAEKEKLIRGAATNGYPPTCSKCVYQRSKCWVNMYHKHGEFGHDPPNTGMIWERAMIELVQELTGLPKNPWYACVDKGETLKSILENPTQFYTEVKKDV